MNQSVYFDSRKNITITRDGHYRGLSDCAGLSSRHRRCQAFSFPPWPAPTLISQHVLLFCSSSHDCPVTAGAQTSLHLLQQLATQRLCGSNPCPTSSSEWAAAGGGREAKSMVLPQLDDRAKSRRRAASTTVWVRESIWWWVGKGNVQHLWCHDNDLSQSDDKPVAFGF